MKVTVVKNWKVSTYLFSPEHTESVYRFYTEAVKSGEIQSAQFEIV